MQVDEGQAEEPGEFEAERHPETLPWPVYG